MVEFIESLKRPFSNWKALLLGIAIGALPVVNLLLIGFALGEAERVLLGWKKPMKWWHMGRIVHNSIAGFAVTVFYLSPVILAAIFFLGPLAAEMVGIVDQSMLVQKAVWGTSPFELAAIAGEVGGQLAEVAAENTLFIAPIALLALAFYYLLPVGLVNFALEGKIMAAFDIRATRRAFNLKYLAYWLLFHVCIAVLFSFLSVLFFLPVLNFLLVGFILFFYASAGFNLYTRLYLERN